MVQDECILQFLTLSGYAYVEIPQYVTFVLFYFVSVTGMTALGLLDRQLVGAQHWMTLCFHIMGQIQIEIVCSL